MVLGLAPISRAQVKSSVMVKVCRSEIRPSEHFRKDGRGSYIAWAEVTVSVCHGEMAKAVSLGAGAARNSECIGRSGEGGDKCNAELHCNSGS